MMKVRDYSELLKVKHCLFSLEMLIAGAKFDIEEEKEITMASIASAVKRIERLEERIVNG